MTVTPSKAQIISKTTPQRISTPGNPVPAKTTTNCIAKPTAPVVSNVVTQTDSNTSLAVYKEQEKDAIKSWNQTVKVNTCSSKTDSEDVIIVDGIEISNEPEQKRRRVSAEKAPEGVRGTVSNKSVANETDVPKPVIVSEEPVKSAQSKNNVVNKANNSGKGETDDVVIVDPPPTNAAINTPVSQQKPSVDNHSQNNNNVSSSSMEVSNRRNKRRNSKKANSADLIIDVDEIDGGINTSAAYPPISPLSGTVQSPNLSVLIPTSAAKANQTAEVTNISPQNIEGQCTLTQMSPQSKTRTVVSPPIIPQKQNSTPGLPTSTTPLKNLGTHSLSPPISPQQAIGVHGLIPPMSPQQKISKKSNIPKYNCGDCGKCFPSNAALTKHHRTHTAIKPFECDVCGKRYSVKQSLKNHIHTHFKEK